MPPNNPLSTPSQDVLDALQITEEDWKNFVVRPDQQAQIKQIEATLNGVSPDVRSALLDQIRQKVSDFRSVNPIAQVATLGQAGTMASDPSNFDYGSLIPTLQQATQNAPSVAGSSIPGGQDLLNIKPGTTTISQYQKDAYKALTGQDFDQAYQAFSSQYAIAVQQYNAQTQRMQAGTEQLWTSGGYQAPNLGQGWKFGQAVPLSSLPGGGQAHHVTEGQFLGMQSQTSLAAAQQIETQASADWIAEYGTPLPDDLRLKLFQAIGKIPPEQLYQVQSASGGQGFAGLLQSGPLADVISEYKAANPVLSQSDHALHIALDRQFLSAVGRPASAADIKALRGADDLQIQRYIGNMQSRLPGMTVSAYQAANANMKQLWQDNFNTAPTDEEIRKFAGWNKDDLTRWVDSQPSKDNPNMTIGRRNGLLSMADSVSQKWYGVPADSRMVDALGQHFGTDVATGAAKS